LNEDPPVSTELISIPAGASLALFTRLAPALGAGACVQSDLSRARGAGTIAQRTLGDFGFYAANIAGGI
jgi:hypothetical protein